MNNNREDLTIDEALNRLTERDDFTSEQHYIVADSNNPENRIYCHSYLDEFKGKSYIKTDYEVYRGDRNVYSTNDGRFEGRPKGYWTAKKKEMVSRGGFSGSFVRFGSDAQYHQWAKSKSSDKEIQPQQTKQQTQRKSENPDITNTIQESVETEFKKLMMKLSSDPEFMKAFMAKQNEEQNNNIPKSEQTDITAAEPEKRTEEKSVEPIAESTADISLLDTSKDSYTLLPIINSKVENQQQRIDTLSVKRTVSEEKISMHQTRIDHLNEKAERLSTTNDMLKELMNSKMTPAFVKSAAQKVIKVNEDKIAKIRNEKIPKRETKIEKQQNKIAKFDRKINLAQCKINRYTSLNNVITSFSLINNSDRRKQFASAMDNLHKSSVSLYNARIDISTAKIVDLTDKYKKSNNLAFKTAALESITRQKISRQKCIDKRNKLIGVIIPISQQSEKVQDEALKQTEKAVNETLERENVNAAEMADNIAAAPLPALPEHSITEPDPTQDINSLLPEIASVMDVSVSELESKPMDIKQMLVLDYTNNFDSTPEDIQESLSAIIEPNASVENNLKNSKVEQTIDSNRPTEPIAQNQDVSLQYAVQAKLAQEQGQKNTNYLKSTEEAVEGNYDMIDGVINNSPPQKEHDEQSPATISMSQLWSNASIADEIYEEQKQDRTYQNRKPPEID